MYSYVRGIDTMPKYFKQAAQVRFQMDERLIGGIACADYVICGECGAIIKLSDIDYLEVYSDWISVSDEIVGN